jgi:GDP-D-mannose dehydratase
MDRPGEYPYTLCDYSNAKEKLDWQPTRNLKDYINDILHTLSR